MRLPLVISLLQLRVTQECNQRTAFFPVLKDGAILSNAGHFNVEIDVGWLHKHAEKVIQRDGIETFVFKGKAVHLLAEGRLVNLATPKAMGHPIEVMDLSFALQALCTQYIAKNGRKLKGGVYEVPREIDEQVAYLKLSSLGLSIDDVDKGAEEISLQLGYRNIIPEFFGQVFLPISLSQACGIQVFLSIPAILPEVFACKPSYQIIFPSGQARTGFQGSDIVLLHDPADPDIDRERLVFLERKEEDTVGCLWSHTGELHKFATGCFKGHRGDCLFPLHLTGDGTGSLEHVGSSIPESASVEGFPAVHAIWLMVQGTNSRSFLQKQSHVQTRSAMVPYPPSYHRDIGICRADIGYEAFPCRLPNQAKSGTSLVSPLSMNGSRLNDARIG